MKRAIRVLLAAAIAGGAMAGSPPRTAEDAQIERSIEIAQEHPEEGPYGPSACIAYAQMKASVTSKWQDRAAKIDEAIPGYSSSCDSAAAERAGEERGANAKTFPAATIALAALATVVLILAVLLFRRRKRDA